MPFYIRSYRLPFFFSFKNKRYCLYNRPSAFLFSEKIDAVWSISFAKSLKLLNSLAKWTTFAILRGIYMNCLQVKSIKLIIQPSLLRSRATYLISTTASRVNQCKINTIFFVINSFKSPSFCAALKSIYTYSQTPTESRTKIRNTYIVKAKTEERKGGDTKKVS